MTHSRYDDWLTTPPDATHYTEDEAAELAEIYAADAVIQRLEREIEKRKFSLRANWEDDRRGY